MTSEETLAQARARLVAVTPLRQDCGRVCGGACCHPLAGEDTGMLLFPGEHTYYRDAPGFTVIQTGHGDLLRCEGTCRREDRPLSCRLFPLLPLVREDGIHVAIDLRGKAVCPLARQGRSALDPAFAEAVAEVGRLLSGDPAQRRFLRQLTAVQDDMKALRKQFGGEGHV